MNEPAHTALLTLAATIALVHTLAGPDHYVPFIAMSRAGRWSLSKTVAVTLLCGIGHVIGSMALGAIGVALGLAGGTLDSITNSRAHGAGWLLIGFGLAYAAWGVRRAFRNRPHTHWHAHANGSVHSHQHVHRGNHTHVHANPEKTRDLTPWVLFTIFVFGPCEPLIPLLMIPAAEYSVKNMALLAAVFSAVTLLTMTAVVLAGSIALARLPTFGLERYGPVLAGFAMVACGAAIQFGL